MGSSIELDFKKAGGLIPVIAQDAATGKVLMLAYMNEKAWQETLRTGKATYYSRSRDALWVKGLTSGHIQKILEIRVDCDKDAILLRVEQLGGAACHTGYASCFFQKVSDNQLVIDENPIFDPKEVYQK